MTLAATESSVSTDWNTHNFQVLGIVITHEENATETMQASPWEPIHFSGH